MYPPPRWESLVDVFQTSCFPSQCTQIIELRPTHLGRTQHVNFVDHFRVDRENALDALAKADLADGEAGLSTVGLRDDHAFEGLQTLLVAFLYLHLYTHRVTGAKDGNIVALGFG